MRKEALAQDKHSNSTPAVVCLGGGVGTVQLIRGLRRYSDRITVVASMADDGGSGGRLRRLFSVPPPGDLINCLAALSDAEPALKRLLTYRFEGDRWGRDDSLGGQKLGNLILVALTKIHGDFQKALAKTERIFSCHGRILPASQENVSIWAKTIDGLKVIGEETIDRGKYQGRRQLTEVHLKPATASASDEVIDSLMKADMIVAGPGDLYTTILPVLLVKNIKRALKHSSNIKAFVVNIANKPFETPGFTVSLYLNTVKRHLGFFPFQYVIINSFTKPVIPAGLNYHYVPIDEKKIDLNVKLVKADLVKRKFPLYHDSAKLAAVLIRLL